MKKIIKQSITIISLVVLAGCCTTHPVQNPEIAGCNTKNVVIKIKLDKATNTPALVDPGQNTVCVESGNKFIWERVGATEENKDFTIFFKDGSFTSKSTPKGTVEFTKTRVSTITAYSYGITMPGAKELDPIIIIKPSFLN